MIDNTPYNNCDNPYLCAASNNYEEYRDNPWYLNQMDVDWGKSSYSEDKPPSKAGAITVTTLGIGILGGSFISGGVAGVSCIASVIATLGVVVLTPVIIYSPMLVAMAIFCEQPYQKKQLFEDKETSRFCVGPLQQTIIQIESKAYLENTISIIKPEQKIFSMLEKNPSHYLTIVLPACIKEIIPKISQKQLNEFKVTLSKTSCLLDPLILKEILTPEVLRKIRKSTSIEKLKIAYNLIESVNKIVFNNCFEATKSLLGLSFVYNGKIIEKGLGSQLVEDILKARAIYQKEKSNCLSSEMLALKGENLVQQVLLENLDQLSETVKIFNLVEKAKPIIDWLIQFSKPSEKKFVKIEKKSTSSWDIFVSELKEVTQAIEDGYGCLKEKSVIFVAEKLVDKNLELFINNSSLDPEIKARLKKDSNLLEGINKLVSIAIYHINVLEEVQKNCKESIDLYIAFIKYIEQIITDKPKILSINQEEIRAELSFEVAKVANHFLDTDFSRLKDVLWSVLEAFLVNDSSSELLS